MAKIGSNFAFSDPKRAPACKKYTTVCWVNIWTATKSHEHLNKLTLRCDKNKNKLFWKGPRDLTLILDPTTWWQKSDLTYPGWLNGKARQWLRSNKKSQSEYQQCENVVFMRSWVWARLADPTCAFFTPLPPNLNKQHRQLHLFFIIEPFVRHGR